MDSYIMYNFESIVVKMRSLQNEYRRKKCQRLRSSIEKQIENLEMRLDSAIRNKSEIKNQN